MAIALVGSVGSVTTGTGTVITPGFAQATTAGNLLVGWFVDPGAGAPQPTLTQSWIWATGIAGQPNSGTGELNIMYKANCGAGETPPDIANLSSGNTHIAALAEFSGAATVSPADQVGQNVSGTTSPQTATAGGVDATTGELVVVVLGELDSKAGTVTTAFSSFNNGTVTAWANNDATSLSVHYRAGYVLPTTANASADAASVTTTSMNLSRLSVALVSFKIAAAVFQPRHSAINFQDPALL